MSGNKKHAEEGGGGHSVGLWYVSFSDMITLLLSFFVMLTTFSSFNKESMTKFTGAWAYISNYSIFPNVRSENSALEQPDRVIDWTETGSEMPTSSEPKANANPRESFWQESDQAYNQHKVLYIPSSRLFWGNGTSITPAGREHLKTLASFLKLSPCQVVIGQSVSDGQLQQGSLDRACTLIEFLMQQSALPADRFSVSAPDAASSKKLGNDPVIEILLLARSITK